MTYPNAIGRSLSTFWSNFWCCDLFDIRCSNHPKKNFLCSDPSMFWFSMFQPPPISRYTVNAVKNWREKVSNLKLLKTEWFLKKQENYRTFIKLIFLSNMKYLSKFEETTSNFWKNSYSQQRFSKFFIEVMKLKEKKL
jgi:hypothetical protein